MNTRPPGKLPQVNGTIWRRELADADDALAELVKECKELARNETNKDAVIWLQSVLVRLTKLRRTVQGLHQFRDNEYRSDMARLADAVEVLVEMTGSNGVLSEVDDLLSRENADR